MFAAGRERCVMGSVSSKQTDRVDGLVDVLNSIDTQLSNEKRLSIDDILDAFGSRTFGPLLVAPALVAISPVGAIPGVPTVLAILIIPVAVPHLTGLHKPWLPEAIRERSVSSDTWYQGYNKAMPWAHRADTLFSRRLPFLTSPPADRIIGGICCLCAVTMVPLEIVPLAVIVPRVAILSLGIALVARDALLRSSAVSRRLPGCLSR